MRLRTAFVILLLLSFVISMTWSILFLIGSGQSSFNHQVEDYMISVISSNREMIGDVFSEVESDISFLVKSDKVRDILRKDIGKSKEATVFDVEGRGSIVARKIENYIMFHPNMTMDEFSENNEFRAIVTEKVGETGYVVITDESTMVRVHINPNMEGSLLDDIKWDATGFRSIFDEAVENGASAGFYDWVDIEGETRQKYAEVRRIKVATADGFIIYSTTSAYLDDYLVAQDVEDSLNNYFAGFDVARDYHNILFISKDNRIIYMVGVEAGIGSKLENGDDGFGDLSSFINNLEGDEIDFYGPFIGHVGEAYLQFAMASRVYDGDEFLGTIVIISDMSSVNEILSEKVEIQFGDFDEDYLVNREGLLITPLRARNVDVMVQEIKTESVEHCLEDLLKAEKAGITAEEYEKLEGVGEHLISQFINFNGDLTFGFHRPIGRANWCILSEVNVQDVLDEPMEKIFRSQIIFGLWLMFFMVLLVIAASFFIDKRYVLENRNPKDYFCGHKGVWRPFICGLIGGKCESYPKGRCGKATKGRRFFMNLKLRYYLLFGIIFATAYFFIMTSFFQGWQNAKLFDDIPDLFVMVIGFMIFAVGLKIENFRARGPIILGGLFIVIRRLFDIPLQEWQEVIGAFVGIVYWGPVVAVEFIGLLLLLVGYGRLKYD